jgi:hypothetical protein
MKGAALPASVDWKKLSRIIMIWWLPSSFRSLIFSLTWLIHYSYNVWFIPAYHRMNPLEGTSSSLPREATADPSTTFFAMRPHYNKTGDDNSPNRNSQSYAKSRVNGIDAVAAGGVPRPVPLEGGVGCLTYTLGQSVTTMTYRYAF